MSESIILHFKNSTVEMVENELRQVSETAGDTFSIPSKNNYLIMVYPYVSYSDEYDAVDREAIIKYLGGHPDFSLCLELRRSRQNEACDAIKDILGSTLSPFNFVIDDCLDKIWTKNEINLNKNEFLKNYHQATDIK